METKRKTKIAQREQTKKPARHSSEDIEENDNGEIDKDLLWKQYESHVGLYKHYLELVLKFNVFYYAATGAILSFYFSKTDVTTIKYSLLFPIMGSILFGILFIYGAIQLQVTRFEMFKIRDKLGFDTAPEFNVLGMLLILSALLMFGVAAVVLVLYWRS